MNRDDGFVLFPRAWRRSLAVSIAWLVSVGASWAQQEIEWEGAGTGSLGNIGQVEVPEGYIFTGAKGTRQAMQSMGNQPTGRELGMMGPEDLEWFVVFEYDGIGYVEDGEKPDADDALKIFKKGQKEDNKRRVSQGHPTMEIVGWAKEPFYNEDTKNLEWALQLVDSEGGNSVNYQTKMLGRKGVMEAVLVCDGSQLNSLLPTYQGLLADFKYTEGNSYAEYKKGDKIAEYGLMGLMVGGAGFAAAKFGLLGFLKKGWILVVAAIAGAGKWLKGLFSGKKNQYTVDS